MTHPLLQPQPTTPEQIADLVTRARAASLAAKVDKSESAARLARKCRVSVAQAAKWIGANPNRAQRAWHRLFPNLPILVSKRPAIVRRRSR